MSKVISTNRTDTPPVIETLNLTVDLMNFGTDFAKKSDLPGRATITNITSPRECPEEMIIAVQQVADIYKGINVDPAYKASSKSGVSILSQVNSVFTITDTEDDTYRVDVPISAHVIVKFPADALITSTLVMEQLGRAVHGLFETEGTVRVDKISRGSLLPTDM
jgi:hypothetical protein